MHFASATAALLRAAGIPARYAEGYVVSASDFKSTDGWTSIPDSSAHAWVEVYLSGYGWIPVEATPSAINGRIDPEGAQEAAALQDLNESLEDEEEEDAEEQAIEASKEEEERINGVFGDESEPNTFFRVSDLLKVLGIFGFCFALLLMNRQRRLEKRNSIFTQDNHNLAAIAVYEYVCRLLRYEKGGDPSEIPQDLNDIFLRARFSQHMLGENEVMMLCSYSNELAEKIRMSASFFRKYIGKYVYALY
jgi:hypothetical protein